MALNSVTYFNFSGGLNTEASVVNIEPNDATDMLNVKMNHDGSVERRAGMDFIDTNTAGNYYEELAGDYALYDEVPSANIFSLTKPTGATLTFVAINVGTKLKLYEYTNYISLGLIDFPLIEFDLTPYGTVEMVYYKTQLLKSRNRIYIINKALELCYIEYDDGGDFQIYAENVFFREIDDVINAEVDIYVNTTEKNYKCIRRHTSSVDTTPGFGADWKTYWVVNGAHDDNVDYWVPDVYSPSNIVAVTFSGAAKGWRTGAMATGRMWLSGVNDELNKIYFSQTIIADEHNTRMYQFADPYNEHDSDTVDTDGGTLIISEANEILKLESFSGGILVFATNGVWYVGGSGGGEFKATDFSVIKVSDEGAAGESTVASVGDKVIYFGLNGVYVVEESDISGRPAPKSLSSEKIDSFYNSIPLYNKSVGKVLINLSEKKVYFFTNFTSQAWSIERNKYNENTHCRDVLIYDIKLQAWSKYSLSEDEDGGKVSIGDAFVIQGSSLEFSSLIDNSGNLVTTETDGLIDAFGETGAGTSSLKTSLLLMKISGNTLSFAFGRLEGASSQDFSMNEVDAEAYDSYIDTAQQIFNDIAHRKQTPYLTTIFKRLEDYILDDDGVDTNAGGCLMTAIWNWSTDTKSFKYGTARQVYLPNRWNIGYEDGSSPGVEVVKNKHRIRGRGNAIQLRFENDGDKPFHLYGWQMVVQTSRRV